MADRQDHWIGSQVQCGRFVNDSELIRDPIRREQERRADGDAVRQALIEGERSGEPQMFDFEKFLRRKRAQYGG